LSSAKDFAGRDVISARDFGREQLELVLKMTEEVENKKRNLDGAQSGKLAALLFFEPSTRTYSSFQIAAEKLGMKVTGFAGASGSSVTKGETLHDTVKMFEGYGADIFVVRHSKMGAARFAAETSDRPVVNAGDGSREHPTQAMLDLYAIKKAFGRIDGLKVGMLGDLRYGRTSSSLAYALSNFDVEITFIAPESLQMRPEVTRYLAQKKVPHRNETELRPVAGNLDVLYVTRIQKERIPDPTEFAKVKGLYEVNLTTLKDAKPGLKVLHPLPRVDELATEVDDTSYAHYFVQAAGGLPLRAVLMNLILGGLD
jgi:aspartate carbamoyltransferase catalytic subunit